MPSGKFARGSCLVQHAAKHTRWVKRINMSFVIENEFATKLRDAGLPK
jgi:hypothetical protein